MPLNEICPDIWFIIVTQIFTRPITRHLKVPEVDRDGLSALRPGNAALPVVTSAK